MERNTLEDNTKIDIEKEKQTLRQYKFRHRERETHFGTVLQTVERSAHTLGQNKRVRRREGKKDREDRDMGRENRKRVKR